ncbi:MAG: argininosuccinate lyase [Promethearchaeota archaeon]|jgi:argininosuccinate lyase
MGKDLYRSRLKASINNKALKFISSLKEDLWIIEEDIIGTEVHDIMLFEQNILSKEEISKILTILESIREKSLSKQLILDQNFEDIHPFIEQEVIDKIGIEIGGKIHTGRSRNDQIAVDLRLKIKNELNRISEEMFALFEILHKLSIRNIETFMPLYTHMQQGQIGVFTHYINNYLAQILRSIERIEEIYVRVNKNPLGACAIGGTSINIDRIRTAELLGFNGIVYNSVDAVSSKDYIYETLMVLSLIALQFSRIGEDIMIWSTKEFGYLGLDDKYSSVSSVMPQKKNPDTIELIRSKSSKVVSNLFSSAMIIKAIPTGYFRDFQDLKMILKNSFDLVFSIIQMYKGIFSTLNINKEKMRQTIENSFIKALDLAELLVQEYDISFRQSHQIVANLVKNSVKPEMLFNTEWIEKYILEVTNKKIELSNNLIQSLKNVENCLQKRSSQGSPSKIEVQIYIDELLKSKESLYKLYLTRIENLENAKNLREEIIKELIT